MIFQRGLGSHGVLLVRLNGVPGHRKMELVAEAFVADAGGLRGRFSVITEQALRVRPLNAD